MDKWQLYFDAVGEGALMVRPKGSNLQQKTIVCQQLALSVARINDKPNWFVDLVPAYESVLFHYDELLADQHQVISWVNSLSDSPLGQSNTATGIRLPICYDLARDNDLQSIAAHTGLAIDEVIAMHLSATYTVYAVGFSAGFAYLGFLPDRLAVPRKKTPRTRVQKGAVAIADTQTAVYPTESPGGWNIIGYCPIDIVDVHHHAISPFEAGNKVNFYSIDEREFNRLDGQKWYDTDITMR